MRMLVVSHLFRNPLEPSNLPNLFSLTQALARDVDVEVVAPVPWFPPIGGFRSWSRFSRIPREHVYGKVRVRYPRYFILPFRLVYFLAGPSFLRSLRLATQRERYDVIWAHYAYPDGWAAVQLGKMLGVPVIVTVRGDDVRVDTRHFRVRDMVVSALREAAIVTSPHPETSDLARGLGRTD